MVARLFYSMLRLIARHIPGFWAALVTYLTLSFAIGIAATALFIAIAEAVREGMTQGIDESILQALATIRSPWLDEIMLEITAMGAGAVMLLMVLVVSLFLWLSDHRWSVYLLIVSVLGGLIINQVLKGVFSRPRPTVVEWGETVSSLSFPSGHAMTSMITYGCIAYLVGRLGSTPAMRLAVWIVAGLMIGAIGFSRMYLGVHYPSDVLAGFLCGAAWLAFVASSLKALAFFAKRRPETRREEHDLNAEAERAAGKRG